MSSNQIQMLIEKIDQLIKVIAIDAVKGKEPGDQVNLLHSVGLTQADIATATGMTQGNVSKILSKNKTASPKKLLVVSDTK